MGRSVPALILLTVFAACAEGTAPSPAGASLVDVTRPIGGIQVGIQVHPGERPRAEAADAAEAALDEIARILRALDPDAGDGGLARLAAGAGQAAPVPVGEDLYAVLSLALDLARRTQGAYDPTRGVEKDGWRRAELHPPTRAVRLVEAGMRLEFGGVAEGFAAQSAWARLGMAGFPACRVTVGPIVVAGEPSSEGGRWPVPGPDGADGGLVRGALATGRGGRAVVTAPDAPSAAAYAAALEALPPDEGLAAAEGTAGVEAALRLADGTRRTTTGFAEATRTKPSAGK